MLVISAMEFLHRNILIFFDFEQMCLVLSVLIKLSFEKVQILSFSFA